MSAPAASMVVGRYVLHAAIARGGMATIHLARLLGAEGFSRTVAAKRLHPQFTEDAEFLKMFLDEARIASKVHHPNVVPVLDVVQSGTEVILVQEYIHGVPLDKLLRAMSQQKKLLPINVVIAIVAGTLTGLFAAHVATDELGHPLEIVHRDVSPQNVLVGVDGIPRLLDFGVAKATLNHHVTRAGVFKGKLAYTSPELLQGVVTRGADIYATSVMLWESLVGRRLYAGMHEAELVAAVLAGNVPRLTAAVDKGSVPAERWRLLQKLDPIVAKGLAFDKDDRFVSAAEMAGALLEAVPAAQAAEVAKWVRQIGHEYLEGREKVIATEESSFRRQRSTEAMPPPEESFVRTAATATAISEPSGTAPSLRASVISLPPARGRAQWAIVAVLLLIGGLLAGIFGLLLRSPTEAMSPASPTSSSPTTLESISTAPAAAPAPAPTVEPSVTPDSGAPSSAPPAAVWRPRAVAPAMPRGADPAPAPTPSVDCTPPFFFDGKKKIFKPGCL